MPLPTSSMLRWVDDIQDTDGYKHSGGTGGGKGNTADVPSIDINEKKGGQSTTGFDMPVQQHISPYAHTGNIEGTGENTIGSNKSAVSYSKGLENGIGIDTNKQIDPSLNPFSSEGCLPWNGQQDIQLEIFDGDAEGLYIEYQNGGENKKEGDSENKDIKGRYLERGDISLYDPIVDQLLEMLSMARGEIGKEYNKGNVGIAIVDIKAPTGSLISNFKSFSQKTSKNGYSPAFIGNDKIFETKYVNSDNVENGPNSYDRLFDSEVKIIEDITHKLGYDKKGVDEEVEGSVFLLTERIPCLSCQYVIDQFQDMFPNVKVVVVYVYKEEKPN